MVHRLRILRYLRNSFVQCGVDRGKDVPLRIDKLNGVLTNLPSRLQYEVDLSYKGLTQFDDILFSFFRTSFKYVQFVSQTTFKFFLVNYTLVTVPLFSLLSTSLIDLAAFFLVSVYLLFKNRDFHLIGIICNFPSN